MSQAPPRADLPDLLNAQTGRIGWPELQRHFARGVVLRVAASLDLVAVAASLVRDETDRFATWLESGDIARADLTDARRWEAERPELWAVVVAPWVLVQETAGPAAQR